MHNNEINISCYRVVRLDRALRSGAGVCAYVRSSLKVNILRDITLTSDDGFQQLWFTVQHKKLRSLDICVAYRPPDVSLVSFVSELTSTYYQAAMLGKDIIILGDLNCNLLADSTGNNNFVFAEVSQELVRDTIMSMPTKKTQGHDKVGMNAIKACLPSILPVITNLFNVSLSSGCLPRDWKLAEVVAHPKDGETIVLYPCYLYYLRSWSALRMSSWLASNNLLSVHQSGNRRCHST